jgi:hypothetical protein
VREEGAWSLEQELCALAGESDVVSAVRRLALLEPDAVFVKCESAGRWIPGGSETYLFYFSVHCAGGRFRRFLLKSIVGYAPGLSLTETTEAWVGRRGVLSENGVAVPRLHAFARATLLEEFVPFALAERLRGGGESRLLQIGLVRYALVLWRLGFRPVAAFGDLRSRGCDVVPVDFGEDLGPAGLGASDPSTLLMQLKTWLAAMSIVLDADLEEMYLRGAV